MIRCMSKLLLSFLLVIFVSGEALAQTEPRYEARLTKKFYSMGTASINGTYYPIGNAISKLLGKKIRKMVTIAEPTAGSVANVKYMKNKQIELALMQSDIAWDAFNGINSFLNSPFKELRVIASLYSEKIQIAVRADSTVKTLADLKGKKIAVGEKDSGSAAGVIQILNMAGLKAGEDYELVYEKLFKSTESLADGYVDAVYYVGGVPADAFSRLSAKVPVRLISIPAEVIKKIVKDFPYYSTETITANSYKGQNETVNTLGFKALLTCTEAMPEEDVITMLTIIYNNPELYGEQSQLLVKVKPEEGLNGFDSKMLHPGSARFFARRMNK